MVHCLTALALGAGVEWPIDCLIIQNRQVVQSMTRSMDWTLEDSIVDDLFFFAILMCHKGGYPICVSRSGNVRHWCRGD